MVDLAELADIHYVRQGEPLGLGHAVSVARRHVGDQPFVVLLGDEFMAEGHAAARGDDRHPRPARLLGARPDGGRARRDRPLRLRRRRAVRPTRLVQVIDMVEKPKPADAPPTSPSWAATCFTPEIFDALERVRARASAARSSSPTPSACCSASRRSSATPSRGPLRHRQQVSTTSRHRRDRPRPPRPRPRVRGLSSTELAVPTPRRGRRFRP